MAELRIGQHKVVQCPPLYTLGKDDTPPGPFIEHWMEKGHFFKISTGRECLWIKPVKRVETRQGEIIGIFCVVKSTPVDKGCGIAHATEIFIKPAHIVGHAKNID